jgi:4-amino-4-deoxy-L-arabinose transferase-like glycosyltransferase
LTTVLEREVVDLRPVKPIRPVLSSGQHARPSPLQRSAPWLALIAILQVALAWRPGLERAPFQDEGLYVFMGHRMLDHLLHGVTVTEHPGSYFSGAPGLYPVLAALADDVGGLQGARALSLLFSIAAMVGVFGLSRELFGRLAGLIAALAFAANGSIIFQSHLATYDSMMLAFVMAAAWLGVRSARRDALLWAPAVALLLTTAVFAKYAALLYVVVVMVVSAAAGWPVHRWLSVRRAGFVVLATAAMAYFVLELFSRDLVHGIVSTTLQRSALAPASSKDLLDSVVSWSGPWYVLAVGGAAVLIWQRRVAIALALLAGSLLGVAGQIHLHEATSLAKQVGFGIAFAAPLIGHLLAQGIRRFRPLAVISLAVVAVLAVSGVTDSQHFLTGWVSDKPLLAPLTQAAALNPGKAVLGEEPSAERYQLRTVIRPQQWNDTFAYSYHGQRGDAAYRAAIDQTHFGVIYLSMTTSHGRWIQSYLASGKTPYRLLGKAARNLRGRHVGDWLIYVPRVSV